MFFFDPWTIKKKFTIFKRDLEFQSVELKLTSLYLDLFIAPKIFETRIF